MAISFVMPLDLVLDPTVDVAGARWSRRPETHVTTLTPRTVGAEVGRDEDDVHAVLAPLAAELERPRPVDLTGEVRIARDPEKGRTLIAMCTVDGAEDLYADVARVLGVPTVTPPPFHVTLFTDRPDGAGIGVATADALAATTALPADEAAVVLAAQRRPQDDDAGAGGRPVALRDGAIRLGQLLKLAGVADSGGEARMILETATITVNGEPEARRGRQLAPGDVVVVDGEVLRLTPPA